MLRVHRIPFEDQLADQPAPLRDIRWRGDQNLIGMCWKTHRRNLVVVGRCFTSRRRGDGIVCAALQQIRDCVQATAGGYRGIHKIDNGWSP